MTIIFPRSRIRHVKSRSEQSSKVKMKIQLTKLLNQILLVNLQLKATKLVTRSYKMSNFQSNSQSSTDQRTPTETSRIIQPHSIASESRLELQKQRNNLFSFPRRR
jgi:hypothetical protein